MPKPKTARWRNSAAALAVLPLLASCADNGGGSTADGGEAELDLGSLEMIVQVSPGGGWDTVSRAVADSVPGCLDGAEPLTVYNRTGQGEQFRIITSNEDGNQIGGLALPGEIGAVAAGEDRDLDAARVLGSVAQEPYVVAVSPASGITSLDELASRDEVIVGNSSGKAGGDFFVNILLSGEMGKDWTYVNHEGSQESGLAAIRGDVDLVTQPLSSIVDLVTDGSLVPIIVFSDSPVEQLPDVPAAGEEPLTEEIAELGRIYRAFMISASAPDAAATAFEEALACVAEDPDFIQRMEDAGSPVTYSSPAEVEELMNEMRAAAEENADRFENA